MVDRVDRRVLGAIRLVDQVTSVPIARKLDISTPGLTLYSTRSNLYVILDAVGLRPHTTAFDRPPAVPAPNSQPFTLTITDPQDQFLPRIATLTLPRPFNPSADKRDLQTPIDIVLASGMARAANPGWAVADLRLRDQGDAPIRGALVEVFPEGGGPRLAWSIANRHGEARLPIPGLSPFQVNAHDPDDPDDDTIATAVTRVDLRVTVDLTAPWPPNPDVLAGTDAAFRRTTLPFFPLTPGRSSSATLTLDLS